MAIKSALPYKSLLINMKNSIKKAVNIATFLTDEQLDYISLNYPQYPTKAQYLEAFQCIAKTDLKNRRLQKEIKNLSA